MKAWIRSLVIAMLWKGALRRVAAERPYVIAITGSVGKTSAKEAIAGVLEASGRPVLKTAGNLNTESGVPLSLLGFEEPPDGLLQWLSAFWLALFPPRTKGVTEQVRPYYVVEYSADHPGDIAFLAGKLPPDVAVITAIRPAHLQYYSDFAALVAEKRSLLAGLKAGGYAVLNAEDPNLKDPGVPALWFGTEEMPRRSESLRAESISRQEAGLACDMRFVGARSGLDGIRPKTGGGYVFHVQTRVIGRQHLGPLLAAAAIGCKEGLPLEAVRERLEAYHLPNGRGRLIAGRKESTIVDDSYNSSPDAVKAGLDMLRPFAGPRRVVALLGTMNELGDEAQLLHEEVGGYAAGRVDFLVAVGQYGQQMAAAAKVAGMAPASCLAFDTPEHLIDKLDQLVQRGDVVYVKASQNGMRLERAVKALMEHPAEAPQLLVRQTGIWAR